MDAPPGKINVLQPVKACVLAKGRQQCDQLHDFRAAQSVASTQDVQQGRPVHIFFNQGTVALDRFQGVDGSQHRVRRLSRPVNCFVQCRQAAGVRNELVS